MPTLVSAARNARGVFGQRRIPDAPGDPESLLRALLQLSPLFTFEVKAQSERSSFHQCSTDDLHFLDPALDCGMKRGGLRWPEVRTVEEHRGIFILDGTVCEKM